MTIVGGHRGGFATHVRVSNTLLRQLRWLEEKVLPTGTKVREAGPHDDVANACAGAVHAALAAKKRLKGGIIGVGPRVDGSDAGWMFSDDAEGDQTDAGIKAVLELGARSLGYESDGRRIVFRLTDEWGQDRFVARHELSARQARQLYQRGKLRPEDVEVLRQRGIELLDGSEKEAGR